MKEKIIVVRGAQLLLCGLVSVLLGCEAEAPPAVWDPAEPGGATPVITKIEPAGAAWAGITTIVITGSNFSSSTTVYFSNSIAAVKNISPTQITMNPPQDTGSAFAIKVVNRDAYQIASVSPYALYSVKKDMARLIDSSNVNALEVDANETVYAHQQGGVYRIPLGQGQLLLGTSPDVPKASCLKLHRDGYLYMANSAKTRIYRMNLATGVETEYVSIRGFAEVFDFGGDGRTIYTGGIRNFSVVDTSLTVTKTPYYTTDLIRSVRVFSDYVYVAVASGIWRNKINADGTLGQPEKYFDWQNAGSAKNAVINDMTFAENGDLYVATDHTDPILIVHPSGTSEFLYPGVLDSPIANFMWGTNSAYLYMNYQKPGRKGIGRVVIDANLAPLNIKPVKGAPYYGRGQ
jgi:hypothetical protein